MNKKENLGAVNGCHYCEEEMGPNPSVVWDCDHGDVPVCDECFGEMTLDLEEDEEHDDEVPEEHRCDSCGDDLREANGTYMTDYGEIICSDCEFERQCDEIMADDDYY